MYCNKCGSYIPSKRTVCSNCGAPVPDPSAPAPAVEPAPAKRPNGIAVAGLIMGILTVVLCWLPGIPFLTGLLDSRHCKEECIFQRCCCCRPDPFDHWSNTQCLCSACIDHSGCYQVSGQSQGSRIVHKSNGRGLADLGKINRKTDQEHMIRTAVIGIRDI